MAQFHPLPPHVHHSTTRLTHREAHTMLSNFLNLAENNAAYRPDSTLSEHGPVSSSVGAATNLTLHHLKRILQGMEGKRVGGADDLEKLFDNDSQSDGRRRKRQTEEEEHTEDDVSISTPQQKRKRRPSMNVRADTENGPFIIPEQSEAEAETEAEGNGWQDKEGFELEQRDDGVNVMEENRHPGAQLQQPTNRAEVEAMVGIEIEETGEKVDPRSEDTYSSPVKSLDKAERKRRKKERRKEEKRKEAERKEKKS